MYYCYRCTEDVTTRENHQEAVQRFPQVIYSCHPTVQMSLTNSIRIPAHAHKLSYTNSAEYLATKGVKGWTCDACRRTSKELQQSHSYRCTKCDFDLCKECTQSLKSDKHQHPLKVTEAATVYKGYGQWQCDNCGSAQRNEGPLSWHCEKGCAFDLCYGCTKDHKSSAHRHSLKKINPTTAYPSLAGWACDLCKNQYRHEEGEKPYNCKKCNFDLCKNCMKDTAVITDAKMEAVQTKIEKSLTFKDGATKKTSKSNTDKSVAKVFISYQWDIQDKVLKLKKTLEAKKITCWMDTGRLEGGDDLKKEIDKGIRGCKVVVSCVTNAYSKSQACQQEVALADVLKKPILPILFETVTWPPEGPMAMPFAPLIYVNCAGGLTGDNLQKVLTTVQSKVQ